MWSSFVSLISHLIQYFYLGTVWLKIPSYGLAIILFTIFIKLVLFPLTLKQIRSMRVMQELQPKIKNIQERYKGQPEKANQMVMELYKEEGANPFSGCLPLLIQMPVLFALFSSLRDFFNPVKHPAYVDLSRAGFLWIKNLGEMTKIADPYFILPILTVLATFLQQYITSKATSGKIDQTQRTMMIMMPLFVGWMATTFPAGLALYWVVYSLVSFAEMFAIGRIIRVGKEQVSKT